MRGIDIDKVISLDGLEEEIEKLKGLDDDTGIDIDDIEDIDDVGIDDVGIDIDNIDEIVDTHGTDGVDELDNIEDVDELDNTEDVDELDNIEDVDELDNIEDVDELDNIEGADELDNIEDVDELDNTEDIDELDSIEDIDELDNIEDVDELDNTEDTDELDNIDGADELDNIEDVEYNSRILSETVNKESIRLTDRNKTNVSIVEYDKLKIRATEMLNTIKLLEHVKYESSVVVTAIIELKHEVRGIVYELKNREAKRKAEEEAKRQAEEEAKRKAEEEAKRKVEEEAEDTKVDYDILDIDELYIRVKDYMVKRNVYRSAIDRGLVESEFGINNVKRLILKSYLISIGNRLSIGKK